MALTGAALFGFVVAHLLGNLQIFLGPENLNRYGQFLQTTPELLWPALSLIDDLLRVALLCKVTAIHSLDVPVAGAQGKN